MLGGARDGHLHFFFLSPRRAKARTKINIVLGEGGAGNGYQTELKFVAGWMHFQKEPHSHPKPNTSAAMIDG